VIQTNLLGRYVIDAGESDRAPRHEVVGVFIEDGVPVLILMTSNGYLMTEIASRNRVVPLREVTGEEQR
jgi:hypothetical protein